MLNDRANFSQYATELLRELAAKAIALDLKKLAHLLAIAVQEAGDIDVETVT